MRRIKNKCKERALITAPQFMNRFEVHLKRRGHTDSTRQNYLSSAKHFISWMKAEPFYDKHVSSKTVQTFIDDHLPDCSCPFPIQKGLKTVRAALNQILLMEGHERIRATIDRVTPEIDVNISSFNKYLRDVCGLADATRWYHRRHIREFLLWIFKDQLILSSKITSEKLCHFVFEKAKALRPGSIGVLVYSLRIYLKFLKFNGCAIPSLEAKIPRPPTWSDANLPEALSSDELIQFWSVFDLKTAIGKRDFAMARCIADIGLRCYEVANMQLSAIDWHNGILNLKKTKILREEALPIPDKMGRALVSYLCFGRPECKSKSLFVYHRAPIGQAIQNTTVRGAIRRAFLRARLPWTGTHILRSTLASRLFEGGASIKEVADVLRHCSIDTTKFYMKINFSRLAQVALPWPGRLP